MDSCDACSAEAMQSRQLLGNFFATEARGCTSVLGEAIARGYRTDLNRWPSPR